MLPWKNGLGVSRIVAASPDGADYDTLRWQVGTTRIEASCPFSSLPGLDRQFIVLQGDGVELSCLDTAGGSAVRGTIDPGSEPFAFRGDWQTDCRLRDSAVQVFNVVTRRGLAQARVGRLSLRAPVEVDKPRGELLLVFVAEGTVLAGAAGATLQADDALLLDGDAAEKVPLRAGGDATSRLLTVAIRENRPGAGQ
jgi:environmental stress-induced protein Ves